MKIKVFNIRLNKEFFESDQILVNDFLEKVKMKKSSVQFVDTNPRFWSVFIHYEELESLNNTGSTEGQNKTNNLQNKINELEGRPKEVFQNLRKWRNEKAEELNVPPFVILLNQDLYQVAINEPLESEELLKLKGFGEAKVRSSGEDIIALLNSI